MTWKGDVQMHRSTVIKLAGHVKHPGNMAAAYSDSHMFVVACIASVSCPINTENPIIQCFFCTQPYGNTSTQAISCDALLCLNDVSFQKVCHLGIHLFLLEMSEELQT